MASVLPTWALSPLATAVAAMCGSGQNSTSPIPSALANMQK